MTLPTFQTFAAGAILASILVPLLLLLYFLRLRRRRQTIGSTMLWKRSVEDLRANAPFQRLRPSWLLFLQLLALLLLAFAVMQPQVDAGRRRGGKTVILVDNSASMLATDVDGAETRLELAKLRARERIEAMYAGGLFGASNAETMVVAFSDRAEVQTRFSTSRQELLDAIDRIRPTHGATRVEEALKLARAYTTNVDPDSDRPRAEPAAIELFSDGRIEDLPDQVLRGETLKYWRVGSDGRDNVAVTTIDVQRPYDRPTAVEVFAALLNYGPVEVACDVQLSVDDSALAVREVLVPAADVDAATGRVVPGRNTIVFTPFEQPRGAVIEVANLRPDALPADDSVRAVVPPPKRLAVALVAPKSRLVETALEGMPLESLVVLSADRFAAIATEGGLDAYDVVVLDDHRPESLPPARYLSFGSTPPLPGLNDYGETDAQVVLSIRDDHPVLRFVNLDQLFVARARLLQPDDDVEVLVEGAQGPIILSAFREGRRVLHVAFDPLETNWPFQRSFVTFLYNAIDWLGHLGAGLTAEQLVPGEAIATRLPAGAGAPRLRTPDGATIPLAAIPSGESSGIAVGWGPIRVSGTHVVTWSGADGEESRAFAVNRAGESEGMIAAAPEVEIGRELVAGEDAEGGTNVPLWPWALGLCLAVLMVEWWLFARRASV